MKKIREEVSSRNLLDRPALRFLTLSFVFAGPLAFGATELWSSSLLTAGLAFLPLGIRLLGGILRCESASLSLLWSIFGVVLIGAFQLTNSRSYVGPSDLWPFTSDAWETTRFLCLWLGYSGLVLAVSDLFEGYDHLEIACQAIAIFGAIISLTGIIQAICGNTAYYGLRTARHGQIFGPYTNKNHAANLLAMCVAVGFGLLPRAWAKIRLDAGIGIAADSLALFCVKLIPLMISIAGLLFTRSRGAITALICAAIVLLIIKLILDMKSKFRISIAILLAVLCLAICGVIVQMLMSGMAQGKLEHSSMYRMLIYIGGWRQFLDFPIWGVGLGVALRPYPAYQSHHVIGLVEHIHNDYLELLMSVGFLGLIVFCSGLGIGLVHGGRSLLAAPIQMKPLKAGLLLAVLTFLFHSLVDFSLQIPGNAVFFFFLFSLILMRPVDSKQAASPQFPLISVVFSCVIAVSIVNAAGDCFRARAVGKPSNLERATALAAIPPMFSTREGRQRMISEVVSLSGDGRRAAVVQSALIDAQKIIQVDPVSRRARADYAALLSAQKKLTEE